jgi:hypothetical protein
MVTMKVERVAAYDRQGSAVSDAMVANFFILDGEGI